MIMIFIQYNCSFTEIQKGKRRIKMEVTRWGPSITMTPLLQPHSFLFVSSIKEKLSKKLQKVVSILLEKFKKWRQLRFQNQKGEKKEAGHRLRVKYGYLDAVGRLELLILLGLNGLTPTFFSFSFLPFYFFYFF